MLMAAPARSHIERITGRGRQTPLAVVIQRCEHRRMRLHFTAEAKTRFVASLNDTPGRMPSLHTKAQRCWAMCATTGLIHARISFATVFARSIIIRAKEESN
ncbi:MAG: hypothetical protein D6735_13570 [Acidobacteria bacterium]|nr:MAG: hypothetical protein D6735_13570 [Acidobacteriota bacterium]